MGADADHTSHDRSTGDRSAPAPAGDDTTLDPAGIDVARLTDWLTAHVPGAMAPFEFEVIAGGHSNLTYRVTAADGRRLVVRRPPLGHVLASAHDMGREHRIIAALQGSDVPVPPVHGHCDDSSVIGAPFYVMEFVNGHVLRDSAAAERALTPDGRANAGRSLIETMAAIHRVDLASVGLDDLGRHDGYLPRQLKRWYGQWNQQKTRDLPEIDHVHDTLLEHVPEQGAATLVHGDYRLDNCMVDDRGDVIAVLDWEICTLGDPLADLGLLMVYWTGPTDEPSAWPGGSTTAPGFWDRARLAEHYAHVTGRDLAQLDVYVVFAYWKLACIIEGVYARYLGGALGHRDRSELAHFDEQVTAAARRAAELLDATLRSS